MVTRPSLVSRIFLDVISNKLSSIERTHFLNPGLFGFVQSMKSLSIANMLSISSRSNLANSHDLHITVSRMVGTFSSSHIQSSTIWPNHHDPKDHDSTVESMLGSGA